MDLGFETIGNATLIAHDRRPVLATDPWIDGPAYFGSWCLSHEVPARQREALQACEYLWLSHGHPDHLSPASLELLRGKPILIGDHYGGRIAAGLRQDGYEVRVLPTGQWTRLSERVRVMCIPDYGQDSVLLVDLDGRLLVDANDASDRGVGDMLRQTIEGFSRTFMLCLTGYGDADMINFFDEDGRRIEPPAAKREAIGPGVAEILGHYGLQTFVPFSSMHKYQRADSVWANAYRTPEYEHARDFPAGAGEVLPPFVRYDVIRDTFEEIAPAEEPDRALAPEEFGDRWSDELTSEDVDKLRAYFGRFTHLATFLGYLRFKVGGREHVVDVARERFDLGITFEVPRASLMSCIEWEVFDDLLIGNYMKTTLHGPWGQQGTAALYPHFTPFVTKFGDNGGAHRPEELRRYFAHYQQGGFFGPGPGPATQEALDAIRPYLDADA